ncbi:unnamed protein product [Rhizoctonia solani]|uniref:Uncharacterized protein n=1 Tax=Rhizoctonia solani TaxID=456999 RepID=A0A8H3H2Z1_9AGAM|nr:unnamed protein product [Rhizoctonia solani]
MFKIGPPRLADLAMLKPHAVWLNGKGFVIGRSNTGSSAPWESREVCVRRRYVSVRSIPAPSAPPGAFAVSSGLYARSFDIRTASLIPIPPTAPVMGCPISPNTTQSSYALANATPVGSGTPTASVIVPGRVRSGTAVGRPIWDTGPG